jgi:ABC-type polysaccharide/polyol phosphate export permease
VGGLDAVMNMIIFSMIFTRVVRLHTDLPYPIFAYAGLLPWNFFASSLRFSAESLVKNTPLVTKVYFPREVLPFSAVLVRSSTSASPRPCSRA